MSRASRLRTVRALAAALVLLLCCLSPAPSGATTVRPLSGDELVRGSADIVLGTVASVRPAWDARHRRIFTEVKIAVATRLKGEPADTLTLVQMGGQLDGVRYDIPGSPVYAVGEEVLTFAWRDRKGVAQTQGLDQGRFAVATDAQGAKSIRGLPADLLAPVGSSELRTSVEPGGESTSSAAPLDAVLEAIRNRVVRGK